MFIFTIDNLNYTFFATFNMLFVVYFNIRKGMPLRTVITIHIPELSGIKWLYMLLFV